MHVAPAEVPVPMRSEATGFELAEPGWMSGVCKAPDQHPFIPWLFGIRIATGLRSLERRNELAVSDVQLTGPGVRGTWNPREHRWLGWIRHVQHAPAAIVLRPGIQIP